MWKSLLVISLITSMAIFQTPAPVPTVTPYLSPSQGGNKNVPVGQTGQSYSKDFIGPILPQYAPAGAPYSSINYNQPTMMSTQYQTPNPTPVPTPPPPPNNGGHPYKGYNVGDIIDGKWRVVNQDTVEPLGGSGGGAPQFDQQAYDNQLNASYDPAFRQADDVEAMYRAEYPTSQEFINNSYAEALTPIQNTLNTQLQGLDTQAAKGKQEEKNQISTARQKYNELRTGGLTRFGGASSTGEAYGELLGRATSQEMGGIGQNFGQYQMDIEKERANVNTFFAERKSNLEKEKQNKLQELKNSFDDEIRKINSSRAALESEKAGKRMAAIQEFSVQARQAQYEAQVFAQKLDAWKAAKDEAVQLATSFGAKSFSIPGMPGVMGGFSVTGQNQPSQSNYISGQGSYTPEDLETMGLSPTGFNSKTGAMTYGIPKSNNVNDPYGLFNE
jgi:hypothetical protein